PRGLMERAYDPSHWSHGPDWVVHDDQEMDWYGFKSIPIIESLTPEIRLVPLPGHTRGHCGIAIGTERGWLLQCGDAASPFHPASDLHGLDSRKHLIAVFPGWFVPRVIGTHVPRLRTLLRDHGDEIEAISAHDSYSLQKYRPAVE
ncbi:MAG: hypothetical protein KAH97_08475, partial [Anaerolineales bacterium]|nr:hypothetical protein [Anaerolineales bacterium]